MKKSIFFVLTIFIMTTTVYAGKTVAGHGFGKTEKEAKSEALADLSQSIHVNIRSEFTDKTLVEARGVKKTSEKILNMESDLPILGAHYTIFPQSDGYDANAVLKDDSLVIYERELRNALKDIQQNLKAVEKSRSASEKARLLKSTYSKLTQFIKYRTVAQFFSSKNIPELKITKTQILNMIKKIESKADTLKFGLKRLSKDFKINSVYIYPPSTRNSNEVTQFASVVKDVLSTFIPASNTPDKAGFFLVGEYKILKDGIDLTYTLTDKENNTLKTSVVSFLPSAYRNYDYKPKTVDFDKLIKTGLVVSSDFRADIITDIGRKNLLFKKGNALKLMVKMTKPGYFYLLVHSFKKGEKYSYLINLNDSRGDRKFIRYVNADEVNKWIVLGEFEVVPPYGVETMQMIASTKDLVDKVPTNHLDKSTQLYKLGGNPIKNVIITRGLMLKKPKNSKKAINAESVLTFTTMK
ncbi:MAG: hypothetical protein GY714_28940 [Desulfobacterales bacterium]|nr:hypothetical protein [Desulfobacterales bacterium]MCP4159313.1 hypothetical protein [Deltaproteobacteria bacterium]